MLSLTHKRTHACVNFFAFVCVVVFVCVCVCVCSCVRVVPPALLYAATVAAYTYNASASVAEGISAAEAAPLTHPYKRTPTHTQPTNPPAPRRETNAHKITRAYTHTHTHSSRHRHRHRHTNTHTSITTNLTLVSSQKRENTRRQQNSFYLISQPQLPHTKKTAHRLPASVPIGWLPCVEIPCVDFLPASRDEV